MHYGVHAPPPPSGRHRCPAQGPQLHEALGISGPLLPTRGRGWGTPLGLTQVTWVRCALQPGGSLRNPIFFFLLRTALKARPQGPATANRQPPTATNHLPPPTATYRHLPPPANCQSPPTANRHQPPTATYRHLPPPTATRQLPIATNRQPPPTTYRHLPPPTATYRHPPTANRHQPPTATNHLPPPTATYRHPPTANRHQPPIATNCQSPPTANRHQPPIATKGGLCWGMWVGPTRRHTRGESAPIYHATGGGWLLRDTPREKVLMSRTAHVRASCSAAPLFLEADAPPPPPARHYVHSVTWGLEASRQSPRWPVRIALTPAIAFLSFSLVVPFLWAAGPWGQWGREPGRARTGAKTSGFEMTAHTSPSFDRFTRQPRFESRPQPLVLVCAARAERQTTR